MTINIEKFLTSNKGTTVHLNGKIFYKVKSKYINSNQCRACCAYSDMDLCGILCSHCDSRGLTVFSTEKEVPND